MRQEAQRPLGNIEMQGSKEGISVQRSIECTGVTGDTRVQGERFLTHAGEGSRVIEQKEKAHL